MTPRAIWKGRLRIGEVSCAVALHAAASTSERISFHMLNRKTGNRLRREFVDAESGKPVPASDQVKGYDTGSGNHVLFSDKELAAVLPESDKQLSVEAFIACADIHDVYFDRPYYVTPADPASEEAFVLLRDGMARRKVAGIARAVLFRRLRSVLIRPHESGLIATTLNFDDEVRPAEEVFDTIPERKIEGEMLDLAQHIIRTKLGRFNIAGFDDRYDAALVELVKAKQEGRSPAPAPKAEPAAVIDLMEALRESAKAAKPRGRSAAKAPAKTAAKSSKTPRRKAG